MNRDEFQALSRNRLNDAKVCFDAGRYEAAYYLAGYAIECALKACIARRMQQYDFPVDRKALENVYTHRIDRLIKGAALEFELNTPLTEDRRFNANWPIAREWTEEARYQINSERQARDLYNALTEPKHGVLAWLHRHW